MYQAELESSVPASAGLFNWLLRSNYAVVLLGGFVLLALAELAFSYSWETPAIALNLGFFTIGMLHGSVDPWQLVRAGIRDSQWHLGLCYLLLMGISLASLVLMPTVAVAVFLCLAGIHFGLEDLSDRRSASFAPLTIFARGILVVGLPIAVHWTESVAFLGLCRSSLDVDGVTFEIVQGFGIQKAGRARVLIIVLAIVSHAMLALRSDRQAWRWWSEAIVLGVCAVLMHPMFFIGLYLVGLHAVKSAVHCLKETEPSQRHVTVWISLLATIPIWVVVLVLWNRVDASHSFALSKMFLGRSADQFAAFVFLSYAVVTLPHLWWHARSEKVFDTQ